MRAAYTYNVESVKALIEAGAHVNARDVDGITTLMHATFNFREIFWKAVREVKTGKTPRYFPDPKNNTLNRPPNDVKMSVKDGGITLVPTSSNVLRYAKTIDEINEAKPELQPKHPKELSPPSESGVVPTEYLANEKSRQESCVNLLLKAGVDVNTTDVHGNTAIGHAVYFGEDHLIDILVKAGAKVNNSGDNGITPLFLAAQAGHNQCLEKLLYTGAHVNAKTVNGFTPLMQAILSGHTQCTDTLITTGADANTVVTLKTCHEDIVKMKEAAMATVSTYLVGDDVIDDLNWKVEKKFTDSKTEEVQFTC